MTISNFKVALIACFTLALWAPLVHAEDAAADQTQVEQKDSTPAPKKTDAVKNQKAKPAEAPKAAEDAPDPAKVAAEAANKAAKAAQEAAEAAKRALDEEDSASESPPNDVDTDTKETKKSEPAAKPEKVSLGSLKMREPKLRLDQIELWREDASKAVSMDVWDGTEALDAQAILPALVMAKNLKIKQIIDRIAMSSAYFPAGVQDMDYIRWRADVLMAQKHPELAARLMNAARLGRDPKTDLVRRTMYEIAANETEAACVENLAAGNEAQPFWQGLSILCAQHLGDTKTAKDLTDQLPDGAMKTAAENTKDTQGFVDAIIKASGTQPATHTIADNAEILGKLQKLLADIHEEDDPKAAAKKNKGQLILLAMGALRAEKHGEDTQKLTDEAFGLAGF